MTYPLGRLSLLAGLLAFFASGLARGATIDPPSRFLFKSEHAIVAAQVTEVGADGKLSLRVHETLSGAPATAQLQVRTSPQWLDGFEPEQRVLVAYTLYRRSPTRQKSLELRPGGALILVSEGLEPALFHDTPQSRALLVKPDDARAASRPWLDRILAGLRSEDPKQQNFFAAELVLRKPLHALLRSGDQKAIARFVNEGAAHPSARSSLLNVAAANPDGFGAQWPSDAALAIVAHTKVGDVEAPLSPLPNLVRSSFDVLERGNAKVPLASARRWLASGQVGLVEAALLAIRRSAPERERESAEHALARADLAPATGEFLRDHLRRLAIMQDALEAERAADREHG